MTVVDICRKALRVILAVMLIIFTMGLDNTKAAYVPDFSYPVGYQSGESVLLNETTDETRFHGQITACELQIACGAMAIVSKPGPAETRWWKFIPLELNSVDRTIRPKPPKSKQVDFFPFVV